MHIYYIYFVITSGKGNTKHKMRTNTIKIIENKTQHLYTYI